VAQEILETLEGTEELQHQLDITARLEEMVARQGHCADGNGSQPI
jgi:hypothetical protein